MTGAILAGLVMEQWADLAEREYRCLMRMALTARDTPRDDIPAATYWAGHAYLAQAWRQWAPRESEDDQALARRRDGIVREVGRVVRRGLVPAGAVQIVSTGRIVRAGHAQVYRLTLDREAA